MARQIPQLLHGMPIINADGTPTKWFVDAWNDLLDRTGGQSVDLVGNIINGTQSLTDVTLAGVSLSTTLSAIDSNITEAATEAAAGSGGLVITLSASAATGSRVGFGVVTTNAVTVSATGGTAPYTFTLTKVSGDTVSYTLSGSDDETVTFSEAMSAGTDFTAQYKWTAEDSSGSPLSGSKNFAVSLVCSVYEYSGSFAP